MERARALAAVMAQRAPIAIQTAKLMVNAAEGEETSAAIEVLAGALAATTADAREGVAASGRSVPPFRGQMQDDLSTARCRDCFGLWQALCGRENTACTMGGPNTAVRHREKSAC